MSMRDRMSAWGLLATPVLLSGVITASLMAPAPAARADDAVRASTASTSEEAPAQQIDASSEAAVEAPPEPEAAAEQTLPLEASGEASPEELATPVDPSLADTRVRTLEATTGLPSSARTFSTAQAGPAKTLVLFDTSGPYADLGEYYALGMGMLASHSGTVTTLPVGDYTAGLAGDFTAMIYTGSTYNESLPRAFLDDVLTGSVPVIWSGFNIWQLAATEADRATFQTRYGWDAASSYIDSADTVTSVLYNGRRLSRNPLNTGGILAPRITDPAALSVLGTAQCTNASGVETECAPIAQSSGSAFPWAVSSANLTYIGEIPLSYLSESDRYLAAADIVLDVLQPNATPVRQAAVRLEDINPTTRAADLKPLVDYLVEARVPFQMAVVAEYLDPNGTNNEGVPESASFADNPQLVEVLQYALGHGGTIVQHGTTHQYGNIANPYGGSSTDDFEFIRSWCTDTNDKDAPMTACREDNFVQIGGELPGVDAPWVVETLKRGRSGLVAAGLSQPEIFETPHYAASRTAYEAMAEVFPVRYERELLYKGLLTGKSAGAFDYYGQFFPYAVNDPYGAHVLPENLGDVELHSYSQHPPRLPSDIVDNARANLVGTHATASFFFHPFIDVENLKEIVEGIRAEGYTFVPAGELK